MLRCHLVSRSLSGSRTGRGLAGPGNKGVRSCHEPLGLGAQQLLVDSKSIFVPPSQMPRTPCSLREAVTQPLCQGSDGKLLLWGRHPEKGVSLVFGGEARFPPPFLQSHSDVPQGH